MSTTYPTSKKTFRDVVDNTDDVLAQDHNDIADTVEEIQDEIGYGKTDSDPDSVQYRLANHTHDGTTGEGGTVSLDDLTDKTSVKLSDMPSSLSGQAGKFLRANTGETAYELASLIIKNYIKGLYLEYSSSTSLLIQPGVIDISNTLLVSVNNIDINPKTASNYLSGVVPTSSWVYVYAYNNSGSVGIKLSTNSPNKADVSGNTDGILYYYTPDAINYYRCIGYIYLDSSSNMYEFFQSNNYIEIISKISILVTTTSNTYTGTYSVSIPTGIDLINIEAKASAQGAGSSVILKIKGNGMSDNYYRSIGSITSSDGVIMLAHEISSQSCFPCKIGVDKLLYLYAIISTGSISAKMLGFWTNIR